MGNRVGDRDINWDQEELRKKKKLVGQEMKQLGLLLFWRFFDGFIYFDLLVITNLRC